MGDASETISYGRAKRLAHGLIKSPRDIIHRYRVVKTNVFPEINILDLVAGSLFLEPGGEAAIAVCVIDAPAMDKNHVHFLEPVRRDLNLARGFGQASNFNAQAWRDLGPMNKAAPDEWSGLD